MDSKKILAGTATVVLIGAMALTGCGGSNSTPASSASPSSSAATSSVASTASNTADSTASSSAAATTNANTTSSAASQTQTTPVDISQYIGLDAARDAAFAHANVNAAVASDVSVELDTKDAVVHYDVEFKAGGLEYDYDIDAMTGSVINSKSEPDND